MFEAFSRRTFLKGLAATTVANYAGAQEPVPAAGVPTEWSYISGKQYPDPFNQVDVDAVITTPAGQQQRIPAFWAGGSTWRVRYAPPSPGAYRIRSVCSDTANNQLHGHETSLTVEAYSGTNPLYKHGALKIAKDGRHFEHADGSPFFWLGDTWWMGLCKRLGWPDGFEQLTADRVKKGFTIVQIVAGLYPDMEPYDQRGANEAGFPWERDFSRINPRYFDVADTRMRHLADAGLAACVVGFWGYFIPRMGMTKVKQHWRYLIARWGAYPTVWCLAGEGTMPYYLSKSPQADAETQKHGLTELARYVRETDPQHRPITIHPSSSARQCVDDPAVLDFDMLQTGHNSWQSVPNTVESVQNSLAAAPRMPVLIGEVCYEGIQESSREEIQRFMFWSAILSGNGGHTYGANGIWQVNNRQQPYGLSPHGHAWGGPPWEVAAQLPGSAQLGLAKTLLSNYSWWKLQPRPELVAKHWSKGDYWEPFAAEIPGEATIAYVPPFAQAFKKLPFRGLGGKTYNAFLFNPVDGTRVQVGTIHPEESGGWAGTDLPIIQDWVIVLENKT